MADIELTPYQQDCLERASWSLLRIAAAAERLVEIVECAASGWLNACPPRGDYKPENNPKDPTRPDDAIAGEVR